MIIGLLIILLLVLFLPFLVKPVEHNLEVFLFVMGILAALVSGVMNMELIVHALEDPIMITLAVLIAGFLFKWLQQPLERGIAVISQRIPISIFAAILIIVLGLISSIITAIIASLVLVAIVSALKLDRRSEILLVVIACFAIGFGAVLTPIGEPLSTITVSKLNESFDYLFKLVGAYIIPGVVAFGILAAFMLKNATTRNYAQASGKELAASMEQREVVPDEGLSAKKDESFIDIIIRAVKVYLFVAGLVFLGTGFGPLIDMYLIHLNPYALYWINIISAILDNATLAAAEISPAMNEDTIQALLLGLVISGGILIPGNIPNIIAANKLGITSKEWAQIGVPMGLVAMVIYFVIIIIAHMPFA